MKLLGKLRCGYLLLPVFNLISCKAQGRLKPFHNLVQNCICADTSVTALEVKVQILYQNLFHTYKITQKKARVYTLAPCMHMQQII